MPHRRMAAPPRIGPPIIMKFWPMELRTIAFISLSRSTIWGSTAVRTGVPIATAAPVPAATSRARLGVITPATMRAVARPITASDAT